MKMHLLGVMSLHGSASSGLKYIAIQEKEVHPSAFIFTVITNDHEILKSVQEVKEQCTPFWNCRQKNVP